MKNHQKRYEWRMTKGSSQLFECTSLGGALKLLLDLKKSARPNTSLRTFARHLEISPSMLSKTIIGHRSLSKDLIRKIGRSLGLDKNEVTHLLLLAEHRSTKDPERKTQIEAKQKRLRALAQIKVFKNKSPAPVSLLHSQIIIEALKLQTISTQPDEIAAKTRISLSDVKSTLKYLNDLGVVKQLSDGSYKDAGGVYCFQSDSPNDVYKNFYRSLLERSHEILRSEPYRMPNEIGAHTLAFDLDQLPLIDKEIDRFFQRLTDISDAGKKRSEIYCGFFHFMPLTQVPQSITQPGK